jgi:cytoskeletal protein CcmA (bactofilin family)
MDANAEKVSVIAEGTSCQGTVTSECPVTVSGAIDGELTAPALVVTESGSVSGKVKVEDLQSDGAISGEIEAETMQLSGKVLDNTAIQAKSLEVKLSSNGSDKLQLIFGTATLDVVPAAPTVGELQPEPEPEPFDSA